MLHYTKYSTLIRVKQLLSGLNTLLNPLTKTKYGKDGKEFNRTPGWSERKTHFLICLDVFLHGDFAGIGDYAGTYAIGNVYAVSETPSFWSTVLSMVLNRKRF